MRSLVQEMIHFRKGFQPPQEPDLKKVSEFEKRYQKILELSLIHILLEQVAVLNNKRFGKSSEKLGVDNQICFMEVDGNIVFFNEDVYKRQMKSRSKKNPQELTGTSMPQKKVDLNISC